MLKSALILSAVVFAYAEAAVWGLCAQELDRINDYIEANKNPEGLPPIGILKPTCLPDGTYAPKQCLGGICRCVGSNGEKLTADTERGLAYNMQCKCARSLDDYRKLGIMGKIYMCDDLGNYENIQCTGSVCYCVESISGIVVGHDTKHISEKHLLKC